MYTFKIHKIGLTLKVFLLNIYSKICLLIKIRLFKNIIYLINNRKKI